MSQLKVYGLNQMEAFKMEQRRSAEATRDEAAEAAERERQLVQREQERIESERRAAEAKEKEEESKREQELCELEKLVQAQARRGRELDYEEIIQCAPASVASSASLGSSVAAGISSAGSVPSGDGTVTVPAVPNSSAGVTAVSAAASENGSSVSSAAPLPSAQKRDASESIYAHIVRRLSALEGNGTLVARYIDEQARALRGAVSRLEAVQQTLLAARNDAERAHAGADARLLRLSTQVEYLRLAGERDRRAAQAQLRALADELGFERRKSVAQLVILIGIVGLALFSKSATVETLLRPLSERPRKKHGKKLSSGPLAGLVIDVATPRPPLDPEGKGWRDEDDALGRPTSPLSPSQPRRRKGSRPTTPTLAHLKRRALAQRSLSMIHGETEDPVAPAPRSKLRSAHLHPLRRADDDLPPYPVRSPRSPTLRSPGFPQRSPRAALTPTPRRRRFPTQGAEDGDEQWDTSVNGTSASASGASDPNDPASASEASNELASEEEEYNGIGGLHPRLLRHEGSFST